MAMRTGCCLNLSPPPYSLPAKTAHVSPCTGNERSWKGQCVLLVGVTCSVVALELMSNAGNGYGNGKKEPLMMMEYVSYSKGVDSRWSDKGACLPWRQNSLETVVPEKLPRPTARRGWEEIGFSKDAPPLATITRLHTKSSSNCFSM